MYEYRSNALAKGDLMYLNGALYQARHLYNYRSIKCIKSNKRLTVDVY